MAVVYRAFEEPRNFSGSSSMTFSLVIELLHPLLRYTVRRAGIFVSAIQIVLTMLSHMLVISIIAYLVHAMPNPLRICCNICCARIPVDYILPLSKHLLQFIRQDQVYVIVSTELLIGNCILIPVLALFSMRL